jgi:hypothetical protein
LLYIHIFVSSIIYSPDYFNAVTRLFVWAINTTIIRTCIAGNISRRVFFTAVAAGRLFSLRLRLAVIQMGVIIGIAGTRAQGEKHHKRQY